MEINPEYDRWQWIHLGLCLFCLERFTEAVDAFEQFTAMTKFPIARLFLAAAYAAVGRNEDARAEIESLGMKAEKIIDNVEFTYRDPSDRERLRMWVQKATQP